MVNSDLFDYLIKISILLNIILLSLDNIVAEKKLNQFNNALNFIFIIEMVLRIFGNGQKMFKSNLNLIEGVLFLASFVDLALFYLNVYNNQTVGIIRTFKVFRLIRLIRKLRFVAIIFKVINRVA